TRSSGWLARASTRSSSTRWIGCSGTCPPPGASSISAAAPASFCVRCGGAVLRSSSSAATSRRAWSTRRAPVGTPATCPSCRRSPLVVRALPGARAARRSICGRRQEAAGAMSTLRDSIGDRTIRDFGEQWVHYGDNAGFYGSTELFADIIGPLLALSDLRGLRIAEIGSGAGRIVAMMLDAGAAHVL